METVKNPLRSLGIMGPAVALIVWVAAQFFPGLGLTEGDATAVLDHGALVVGALLGIYGRWRATSRIG